ncbi:MAG: hypothetical protein FWF73_03875 [Spirochaetes bacterium]|nr:hypothetical protein [Spirochaetota bacterium]
MNYLKNLIWILLFAQLFLLSCVCDKKEAIKSITTDNEEFKKNTNLEKIKNREYYYKILEEDSLARIADKHGLKPPIEWARKILEDSNNSWMHTESDKYGKKVKRQIHIGNHKYAIYDSSKYGPGYRGYEDPHQIIFYAGEKIWIPKEVPTMKVRLAMEAGTYSEDEKYTLSGYDDNGELIYRKSLIVKEDAIDNNGIKELIFQATPRNLKYTLEVTFPADDKNKEKTMVLMTDAPYN